MDPLLDMYISVDNTINMENYEKALADFVEMWGHDLHVFCNDINQFSQLDRLLSILSKLNVSTVSFMEGVLSREFHFIDKVILEKLAASKVHALCILIDEYQIQKQDYENYISLIQGVGLRLEVYYRVDAQNTRSMRDVLLFCEKKSIKLCVVDIDKTSPRRLAKEEYKEFLEMSVSNNKGGGVRMSVAECPYLHLYRDARVNALGGCSGGIISCLITEAGEVVPCMYLREMSVGNINNERLKHIWHESNLFKSLRDRDNLKGKCGRCEHKKICGGCRAESVLAGKGILDEDPNCWL